MQMHKVLCERANDAQSSPRFSMSIISQNLDSIKEDYFLSPRFFYDDVKDMDPFVLGEYTWNGYTCTSLGYPYTMLEAKQDGCVFQVMILTKNGEYEISLTNADVQTILTSLTQTN